MRAASGWRRRGSIENRFCVPDCLAALKAGLWEEAVKLLWIHTSKWENDTRYWLEFFECIRCGDQRAHFKMEKQSGLTWIVDWIWEAYRFEDALQLQKFIASEQSREEPSPADNPPLDDVNDRNTL